VPHHSAHRQTTQGASLLLAGSADSGVEGSALKVDASKVAMDGPGWCRREVVAIMDKAPPRGSRAQETRTMNTTCPRNLPSIRDGFKSFAEFYPFYLTEHADRTCRRLHFAGSTLSLLCLVALVLTLNPWWLLAGLVAGYGFAWVGHFGFEKNKPASFKRPLYSFMGDWAMYRDIWLGRVKI
jgi:hypothetical protein